MAIAVTVDCVVFAAKGLDVYVALIKRANPPYKGKWALPGGFVEKEEDLKDAAIRELNEETGLRLGPQNLIEAGVFGTPGRDPRGRTVTAAFEAFSQTEPLKGSSDAREAKWVRLEEAFQEGLAFDHTEILRRAVDLAVKRTREMIYTGRGAVKRRDFNLGEEGRLSAIFSPAKPFEVGFPFIIVEGKLLRGWPALLAAELAATGMPVVAAGAAGSADWPQLAFRLGEHLSRRSPATGAATERERLNWARMYSALDGAEPPAVGRMGGKTSLRLDLYRGESFSPRARIELSGERRGGLFRWSLSFFRRESAKAFEAKGPLSVFGRTSQPDLKPIAGELIELACIINTVFCCQVEDRPDAALLVRSVLKSAS